MPTPIPNHRRERGGEGGHSDHPRHDREEEDGGGQRQQRRDDRQSHRHHGTERDQQHEGGCGQSDDLCAAGRLLLAVLSHGPADFHPQAVARRRVGGIEEGLDAGEEHLEGGHPVLHGREGDAPVSRDLAWSFVRRTNPDHLGQRREAFEHPFHARLHLRAGRSSSLAKTSVAPSPACDGKRSWSRSMACCDSVPGIAKLSTKSVPATRDTTTSSASVAMAEARTR